jgi:hypothetical protein
MADTLSLLRALIRVEEAGSLSRVVREQNSSQPTVSRRVAALEEHLSNYADGAGTAPQKWGAAVLWRKRHKHFS